MGRESHRLRLFLAIEAPFFPEIKVFSAERAMTPLLRHGVKLFSLAIVALGAETILCARVDGDSRGSAYALFLSCPGCPQFRRTVGTGIQSPCSSGWCSEKQMTKRARFEKAGHNLAPQKLRQVKGGSTCRSKSYRCVELRLHHHLHHQSQAQTG